MQRARFALQMAEFAEKLGRRMKRRRKELQARDPRWTQEYVARRIRDDLGGAQYARWERGEHVPREETIPLIAAALEMEVEELYADPAGSPPPPEPDVLDALRQEVQGLRTELLSELGKVRKAQEALRRSQVRERRRAGESDT